MINFHLQHLSAIHYNNHYYKHVFLTSAYLTALIHRSYIDRYKTRTIYSYYVNIYFHLQYK